MSKRRVALYARYSTAMQQQSSIDDQFRICSDRAEREGWEVVARYSDAAITGASYKRPGLTALLTDAKDLKFDCVIAESMDRIAGDMEYAANIYKRLSLAGVKIHSLSDGGDMDVMQVGIAATFAAMRLKGMGEKTRRGQEGRAIKGKIPASNCYGYRVVKGFGPDGKPIRGEREIVPEEAAIIWRIHHEYARERRSAQTIAQRLNREGIPGPGGRPWHGETIRGSLKRDSGILRNRLNIGELVYGRNKFSKNPDTMGDTRVSRVTDKDTWIVTPVPHLKILDKVSWDWTQARLEEQVSKPLPYRKMPPKLLSYRLRCGECGHSMEMRSRTKYGCTGKKRGLCDNGILYNRVDLERTVLNTLKSQFAAPELCELYSRAYIDRTNQQRKELDASAQTRRDELARIEREVRNLMTALKQGVEATLISDELNGLSRRRIELEKQLKAEPGNEPLLHGSLAKFYRANIERLIGLLESETHREESAHIVHRLIDKIVLTPNEDRTDLIIDLYGNLAGILQMASKQDSLESFRIGQGFTPDQVSTIEQVYQGFESSEAFAASRQSGMQGAAVSGSRNFVPLRHVRDSAETKQEYSNAYHHCRGDCRRGHSGDAGDGPEL